MLPPRTFYSTSVKACHAFFSPHYPRMQLLADSMTKTRSFYLRKTRNQFKAKRFIARTAQPYTNQETSNRKRPVLNTKSLHHDTSGTVRNAGKDGGRCAKRHPFKGTVCALHCQTSARAREALHPSEVIVDHMIPRAKFKDPREEIAWRTSNSLYTMQQSEDSGRSEMLSRMR